MTILSRPSALVAAATFLGLVSASLAQTSSIISPGSYTLFHPQTDLAGSQTSPGSLSEGLFTKLPFTVAAYTNVGYDDNLFFTHDNRTGSGFNSLGLNLGSHIGNLRTRLDALLSAGVIAYWNRPGSAIAPNISLNLNFTHQFNERTVFGFSTFTSYEQESNVATGLDQASNQGNYFYSSNTFTLGYWLTHRISLITTYNVVTVLYDNSAAALNNNYVQNTISQQVRYLLLPTVNVALEFRYENDTYFHVNNDSDAEYLLAGADVTLSPKLSFAFRLGAQLREQHTTPSGTFLYPTFESTLTYEYRPESTVQWLNQLGLGESSSSGQGYREYYQTGLSINHSFGKKLKAVAALTYSYNKYSGNNGTATTSTVTTVGQTGTAIDQTNGIGFTGFNAGPNSVVINGNLGNFTENILDLSVGVAYQVTRPFSVNAGYTFTRDFSSQVIRDYYRNRIYLGVQFAF
ncbi:MAG TPA: outer membrane beta-barrel protein [Chthoniobacterales bacterium]